MRNFYARLKAYALALTLLVVTSVIIYSCKKDRNPIEVESDTIAHLQAWYEVQIGENPITSAIFRKGSTPDAKIPTAAEQELKIDWANAKSYESKDRTIIEVPVLTAGIFMFNTEPLTKENNQIKKDKSITRLLISETNDYKEAYFMTIISSADYLANTDAKPENNTYLKQQDNFEGLIIYHNLKGDYVAGKKFGKMQNELDKQLSLSPVKDRKVSIAVPDNCREIYIYQIMGYNCVDVGSNFTYCESTYSNYVGSQTICGTGHQTDPWQGNPWGGGSGSNNSNVSKIIVTDTSILNNAKAKCALLKLLNNNKEFDDLIKAFTGAGFNLTFKVKDALINDLPNNKPRAETTYNPTNKTDMYINLRRSWVNTAPPIQIAKTLLHEAFHANLMQRVYKVFGSYEINANWSKKPEDLSLKDLLDVYQAKVAGTTRAAVEHEYIAQNINAITGGLKEFAQKYDTNYSNYDEYDYLSLAWEGLDETESYKNNIKNTQIYYVPQTTEHMKADSLFKIRFTPMISSSNVNCPQ